MAAMPRESSFMPTIKCSSCGCDVEISLMGEHICKGAEATEPTEVPPPLPSSASLMAGKIPRMMPPNLDTSAANRSFAGQGQLTPVSLSSGSRGESPKTPNGRLGSGRPEDYSPEIAGDSPTLQSIKRPGGYGGFGEPDGNDAEPLYPVNTPNKPATNVLQRMNTIAPGPFDAGRRPSATGTAFLASTSPDDRPGTSMSNTSSSGSMRAPSAPRNDGYGGFGPPKRSQTDFVEPKPYGLTQRSDTFPRASGPMIEHPARAPSAPGPRPDRLRRPSDEDVQMMPVMGDRLRRPSKDTSRPPPPRPSIVRSQTAGPDGGFSKSPVNVAAEFGVGNPYHTASSSISSSYSRSSSQRSGKPSQSSLDSSPPRSVGSRLDRKVSDASATSSLTEERKPKELSRSPSQPLQPDKPFGAVLAKRLPRPDRGGYDPRIAPNAQRSGLDRAISPLASPAIEIPSFNIPSFDMSTRVDPAIQEPRQIQPPAPAVAPAPAPAPAPPAPVDHRVASPERVLMRTPSASQSRDPAVQEPFRSRPEEAAPPPPEPIMAAPRELVPREPAPKEPTPSESAPREPAPLEPAAKPLDHLRPRDPAIQAPSRGNCKSCKLPITGKSISSADGRLTGRYHKACFVCTTCREAFTSATFYVLDDKPYCEQHYHRLNGSLCGGCGNGIEGQYLEDENTKKHHPGCFRCGDCGVVLKDGYFDVNGRAFCEKDAWRRMQQPWTAQGGRKGSMPGLAVPPGPSKLGLPRGPGGPRNVSFNGMPNAGRLAPGGPPPIPRMEKRMTRLGMM